MAKKKPINKKEAKELLDKILKSVDKEKDPARKTIERFERYCDQVGMKDRERIKKTKNRDKEFEKIRKQINKRHKKISDILDDRLAEIQVEVTRAIIIDAFENGTDMSMFLSTAISTDIALRFVMSNTDRVKLMILNELNKSILKGLKDGDIKIEEIKPQKKADPKDLSYIG